MNEELMITQEMEEVIPAENQDWSEHIAPKVVDNQTPEPLLGKAKIDELRARWNLIQTGFVDDPRIAVEQADLLVTDALKRIESELNEKRATLTEQWDGQTDASTEDLRIVLRGYRSYFDRLLTL